MPLAKCAKSRVNTSGASGVASTRVEEKLLPILLTARTSKTYSVPLSRPVTVWVIFVEPMEIQGFLLLIRYS